jgi:hypothetical protein
MYQLFDNFAKHKQQQDMPTPHGNEGTFLMHAM